MKNGIDDTPIGTIYLTESFYFLYCLDGDISFYAKEKKNLISLKKGEMIIVQPNCPLIMEPKNHYFIVSLMKVTSNYFLKEYFSIINNNAKLFRFFLDPFSSKNFSDFLVVNNLPVEFIEETFKGIDNEYNSLNPDKYIMMRALLQMLIIHISRCVNSENSFKSLEDNILQYILYNPNTSLRDVSDNFKYHPNYISGLIKKKTGHTFKEILIQNRMDKAINFLKNSDYKVEEIANIVGYSDPITFYKAFKKYYGCSPKSIKRIKKQ